MTRYNSIMTIDASDVFNPADFESVELSITFKNITTHTDVKENSKNTLEELGERKLVLGVPAKTCNVKHSVMVEVNRIESKTKKLLKILTATGKVVECEDVGEDKLRIVIEVVQADERSWNDLQKLFSKRQEEIERFLTSVRGY